MKKVQIILLFIVLCECIYVHHITNNLCINIRKLALIARKCRSNKTYSSAKCVSAWWKIKSSPCILLMRSIGVKTDCKARIQFQNTIRFWWNCRHYVCCMHLIFASIIPRIMFCLASVSVIEIFNYYPTYRHWFIKVMLFVQGVSTKR